MNAKRKLLIAVLTVLGVSLLVAGTLAARQYTVYNDVHTGQIDVELNWVELEVPDDVLPGEKSENPVSVTNQIESGDAYIRVKVVKSFEGEGTEGLNTDYIIPMKSESELWQEQDGYYYYMKPLAANAQTETLFDGIQFDSRMDNSYGGKKAKVMIMTEAVQMKNNGDGAVGIEPWKDVVWPSNVSSEEGEA